MSAVPSMSVPRELAAIVGEAYVCSDPEHLRVHAIDGAQPGVAVSPANAEETAAVLALASGRGLTVVAAGGFTQQAMGRAPHRVDILLRTSRLNAVEHYDPGDLTIGVGAGMRLADVVTTVSEHKQVFPLDAMRHEVSTVGGALATAAEGPLRHGYGAARDYCIGVRFATADGKLGKGGGQVVKNVAGYDLMKLLIGSHGTLAVITGASFKLFPRPELTRTFVCDFHSVGEAMAFRDRLMTSALSPLALELASPRARNMVGLIFPTAAWSVIVRAGGSETVLARYSNELGSAVSRVVEGEPEMNLWRDVCDFASNIAAHHACSLVARVNVPMQGVETVINGAKAAARENEIHFGLIGRVGVGSLLVAFTPVDCTAAPAQFAKAVEKLRQVVGRDGSVVVTHCLTAMKKEVNIWGPEPAAIEAMRKLKQAMDPADILNRGRFLL